MHEPTGYGCLVYILSLASSRLTTPFCSGMYGGYQYMVVRSNYDDSTINVCLVSRVALTVERCTLYRLSPSQLTLLVRGRSWRRCPTASLQRLTLFNQAHSKCSLSSRSSTLSALTSRRRPRESESEGRLPPLQLEGVAGGGRAEPGRVDAGRATRGGDRRLGHN